MTELQLAEVTKTESTPQAKEMKEEIKSVVNQVSELEESEQDRNWKKWRENRQKEREEAVKETAARLKAEQEALALREALAAAVGKPNLHRNSDNYEQEEESEDQRIDRRVSEALSKKEAEYERKRAEQESQEYPSKLRNTFKDFEQVCSAENLDYLEYHHPELAKSLGRIPQGFDKWADIYSAIKRYVPNPDSTRDVKKANKNLQKPQSLSHSSLSSEGTNMTPTRLTDQRRKENWERMQRTLKGLS